MKISGFLISFFFCFPINKNYGNVTNVSIDSIISQFKTKTNVEDKIRELLVISRNFYDIGNTAALQPYLKEIELFEKIEKDNLFRSEICYLLGNCMIDTASDKSIEYYNTGINLLQNKADSNSLQLLGKIYTSFGWVYQVHGEYQPAIGKYIFAEKYSTEINDYQTLISIYTRLGDIYNKLNSTTEADKYFFKAFSLAEKTTNKKSRAKCLSALATVLIRENKIAEAHEKFLEALQLGKDIGDLGIQHNMSYNLGFIYCQQDKYPEAILWYTESYKLALRNNNKYDVCDAIYKIGLVLYYMEKFKESEKKLDEAFLIADSIHSKILQRNILDVYNLLEAERGNFEKAYKYLYRYVDIVYAIFSEEDQRQVNFLKAQFDTEKKESLIVSLVKEKEYKERILKRRNLLFLSLAVILILAVILLFFLIMIQKNQRKIAEQENRLAEEKIKQLEKERQIVSTQAVLQGEEAERSRLARDLHDGLGGLLSGVKLNLTNMKGKFIVSQENVDQFDHALNLLDNSIRELRRVAHNMMPEALIKFGLKDALHDFCSQLNNNKEITFKFQFFGIDQRMENQVEISMYRIAQELLNNSVKHSQADEIIVQLIQEEQRVNLTIQDNGKGYDQAAANNKKGAGLANIRARVDSLKGRLDIDSKPGRGTEVIVEFQLNKKL